MDEKSQAASIGFGSGGSFGGACRHCGTAIFKLLVDNSNLRLRDIVRYRFQIEAKEMDGQTDTDAQK